MPEFSFRSSTLFCYFKTVAEKKTAKIDTKPD